MSETQTLPSSPETESDVVGACIAEGQGYWRIIEQMGGDEVLDLFHNFEIRMVATAIQNVLKSDKPLTRSTVTDELSKNPASERLVPHASGFVTQLQITNHIRNLDTLRGSVNALIKERSKRKALVGMENVRADLMDGELTLDEANDKLRNISMDNGEVSSVTRLGDVITKLKAEKSLGVEWRAPTGLRALDGVLNGGYEPRRMYLIGARPKVGKSMILFNGALEALASPDGCAVLFVSLELSEKELFTKMLSAYSSIEQRLIQDIFDGHKSMDDLSPDQQDELNECEAELIGSKLYTMFVTDIRDGVNSVISAIMSLRLKYGEGYPIVVFIDYIQLFVKSGHSKREEIEDASRKLKLAALEFSVSVVAAAQVNRSSASAAGEGNGDGMPRSYMLRDSGSLEQDADIVMMLNRPILQDESAPPELMNILVELNRTGPSGKVLDVKFLPEFQQLADYDLEDDDPDNDDYDEPRQKGRASREALADTSTFAEDEPDIVTTSSSSYSDDDEDDEPRARRTSRPRRNRDTIDEDGDGEY